MNNGHCGSHVREGELFGELGSEPLSRLVHVEQHPNGGASVVHVYQEELNRLLPREQAKALAELFFKYDHTPSHTHK